MKELTPGSMISVLSMEHPSHILIRATGRLMVLGPI